MIIVMGLPGAGKSTVLAKAEGYEVVNYGTLMFEIAQGKFGLENRDQMRSLPVADQKTVQEEVAKKLSEMQGKVILDTHCSVETPKGYLPGLPFSLLEKLTVEAVVLITATPEEIKARREGDPSRVRKADIDSIKEHDFMNKAFLAAYAAHRGVPAKIIYNRDGKVEEAAAELRSVLE